MKEKNVMLLSVAVAILFCSHLFCHGGLIYCLYKVSRKLMPTF